MAPELRVVRSPDLRLPYLSQNWRRLICAYGPLDNGIYGLTSLLGEISTGRYFLTGKIGFCNPATRDYKLTNPFPYSLVSETRFFLDPIFANFGFGSVRQDSGMVDHKVVVLISRKPFSSYIGFVYSLQSGEWKKLVDYELDDNKAFHVVPVPLVLCPEKSDLKGHWHWLAKTKPPHDLSNQPFVVLSFDFADEVFKIIGGPPCDYDDSKNYVRSELLVLHDHLVVIYVHEVIMHSWCVEINAWMMMEYGVEESWTMIYKIQPNCFGRLSRLVGIDSYPVRDEETSVIHIERLSFEDQYHEKTIIFNKDGFKAVEGCKSYSDIYWNIAGISTYMETLEPLRTCFANGKNLLEEGKDTQRRISKDICEKYKGKRILDTTDNPAGSLTSDGVEDSGNKQTTLGDKVIKMGMISPEDS